ncbi:hypothetical protein PMAYCL1PPCAC_01772 [Pristionchus mayeri]|uniref:Uncharacterized protein n=1 Tax=Pristionchus mayeri TaxID=1317129 RepID=A0AAN5C6C4_9BILA|nr:hypothetical protein PMAYCL1PPCAC_01772 [Pristionchus mayeri]
MKVTFYPYQHPGERPKTDKAVWTWHKVLFDSTTNLLDEAGKAMATPTGKLALGVFSPIEFFHEPPLRRHIVPFRQGMVLEVELTPNDKMRTEHLDKSVHPSWIAEVIHTVGYYSLLRWCGAKKSDGVFWVHTANAAVHPVGFSCAYRRADRSSGYAAIPPNIIFDNHSTDEWCKYAKERVLGKFTPKESFDDRAKEICFNKFKVGDRVETIDDDQSSIIAPATVKRILGRRVLLEYSKNDIDKADHMEKENMWKDMNDDLIYPVGFAATMGLEMKANKKYKAHVKAIADAIKEGKSEVPYAKNDARKEKVYQWRKNEKQTAEWEVDMVCEMIDRLDECQNVLKAARVIKVLPDGFLQLGPDGADIISDSFHVHQTSPNLFPVGYAMEYSIALQGPKGDNEEVFDWKSFLKRTNYKPAPENFFHCATACNVAFKVGMRMEAIDQNEKMLCPATVKAIKGRLVLVGFDGWDDEYDQLYDFRSNELLPCGWGEMVGHALQAPVKTAVEEGKVLQAEEVSGDDSDE